MSDISHILNSICLQWWEKISQWYIYNYFKVMYLSFTAVYLSYEHASRQIAVFLIEILEQIGFIQFELW